MSAHHSGDTAVLIEHAATSFRERDQATGRIQPAPAFLDLAPAERDALFSVQMASRLLERALDPGGLSSTARAVLLRLPRLGQLR